MQTVSWLFFALKLAALAFGAVAVVHAIRQRADAFPAVGKLTKPIWLGILAVSTIVIFLMGPVSLFGVIGVVAIGVYMADVRPKVDEIQQPKSW
ncbi:DUF2516 family protein [Tomitella biformata]|uniref:DUF2516 family protein n=1 Tax=Tomitella biformata TaxID=630403 RepID=UPI00056DA325|nr:DUF2516 family protein [Tomitella biformata]